MALNIGQQGSFLPFVKFDAKAGRWFVQKDEQTVEVSNPTFVADFAEIKTGWLFLKEKAAPEFVPDISLSQPAQKPARTYTDTEGKIKDCFKRGFKLSLFSKQAFGGVVEMQSASMHLSVAINDLYTAYEAGLASNPGALPVVQCTGVVPMKDKQGTNYKPTFTILKWVPRPTELDDEDGGNQALHAIATSTPQQVAATIAAPQAQAVSEF